MRASASVESFVSEDMRRRDRLPGSFWWKELRLLSGWSHALRSRKNLCTAYEAMRRQGWLSERQRRERLS